MVLVAIETRPQLEFINKKGEITPNGRVAHGIVVTDYIIKNHYNSETQFSLSPELLREYEIKLATGVSTLDIEVSEAEDRISQIRTQLEGAGFPLHRLLSENNNRPIEMGSGQTYAVPFGPPAK